MPKKQLQQLKFGTVGHDTEERLHELGYHTALAVPQSAGWMNFVQALDPAMVRGKRVLLLQSQIGLHELDHAFKEMGAETERVVLYVTKGPSLGDSARLLTMLESQRPDVIAFFSPSSVAFFVTALAEMGTAHLRDLPAIACIGETTAREVEERLRRRPEIVARKADQESLAKDILIYIQSKNLTLN